MNYRDYMRAKEEHMAPRNTKNITQQDLAWLQYKQNFLDDLREEIENAVNNMRKHYPDEFAHDLQALVAETMTDTYKRVELYFYRFPQYAQPYDG